jgi:hypothetical protein
MSTPLLPLAFADLEPFVADWCCPTEKERAERRVNTDIETLRGFHAAVSPRMEEMILFFNTFPNDPHALPPEAKRLYTLAQMVMEVSPPIDLNWPSSDIEDVFPLDRITFVPVRGSKPLR